jgi:hypothetical protein
LIDECLRKRDQSLQEDMTISERSFPRTHTIQGHALTVHTSINLSEIKKKYVRIQM